MKLKVKNTVLVEKCEARLKVLRTRQAELETEQESGKWREDLRKSLRELADEVTGTEIMPIEIMNQLGTLRSLTKAEGLNDDLRYTISEIKNVENTKALLASSSSDGYMVDSTDSFWMKIMNPESPSGKNR